MFLTPIENAISVLEDDNNRTPSEHSILLKKSLVLLFGDYKNFMAELSPLGESIKTGILELPDIQGGKHNVKWKKIR